MKQLLLLIVVISAFTQNFNDITIGIFVGEPTNIFIGKRIKQELEIQFSVGINELFINYGYNYKYIPYRTNQNYDQIYNLSMELVHHRTLTKNYDYRIITGIQNRIIKNYSYQKNPEYINTPSNVIIENDPITITKLNVGINSFVGIEKRAKNNLKFSFDVGIYTEIIDKVLWANPQFKMGIAKYLK